DAADGFDVVPVASYRDLKEHQRQICAAGEIFEKAEFELAFHFTPGEEQRRKNHHGIHRYGFEITHQVDGFVGGLRRDGRDVYAARVARDLTDPLINATFLLDAKDRPFADARARYQSGDVAQGREMGGQPLEAIDVQGTGLVEGGYVRDE